MKERIDTINKIRSDIIKLLYIDKNSLNPSQTFLGHAVEGRLRKRPYSTVTASVNG